MDDVANFAVSSVATAPTPATSGPSLVVAAGEGSRLPAAPINASVWPAGVTPTPDNAEIVRVTARTGDTLTITRAQEGTAARSVVAGDVIAATITAKTLTDLSFAELVPDAEGYPVLGGSATSPAAPPAGTVTLFARDLASRMLPAIVGPSGLDTSLQPFLGRNRVILAQPVAGTTTVSTVGITLSATGTGTAGTPSTTSFHTSLARVDYLVTAAANNAVAGWRSTIGSLWRGNAAGRGGFTFVCRWSPATGVATTTMRTFVGLTNATADPTDVQPSSLTNMIGVGWDAADANMQMMTNDGTGTATKVDLGTSFPVPTTDRPGVWELALFAPPNGSAVNYLVTNVENGASASGTITTDLPSSTTFLAPRGWSSVGGTSSLIGHTLFSLYIETDY